MNYSDFFTQPNGFPLESDSTLGFMQTDYQSAIKALGKLAGEDNIILTGLVVSGGVASNGWILYGGDVVFFQGGAVQSTFIIVETVVNKNNQNGASVPRYTTKRAVFGTGTGAVAFSTLVRVQSLSFLQERLKSIVNPTAEEGVLISGFGVLNDTPGAGQVTIAAGFALVGSTFVSTLQYVGVYPVYLKEDGTYTTTEPVSGSYITFDPYSSQEYGKVQRRAQVSAGEVVMSNSTSVLSNFDGTGLGKWAWKGWAIANGANGTEDMRGLFVVGYDNRTADPGGDVWDFIYTTIGNDGGEKEHVLMVPELPASPTSLIGYGLIRRSLPGENVTTQGVNSNGSGTEPDVESQPANYPYTLAASEAHENRPPFLVVAYIQRIA